MTYVNVSASDKVRISRYCPFEKRGDDFCVADGSGKQLRNWIIQCAYVAVYPLPEKKFTEYNVTSFSFFFFSLFLFFFNDVFRLTRNMMQLSPISGVD